MKTSGKRENHHRRIALLALLSRKGIRSRTPSDDDRLEGVTFPFAQGREWSKHTASMPIVLYLLQGKAAWTLGGRPVRGKVRKGVP